LFLELLSAIFVEDDDDDDVSDDDGVVSGRGVESTLSSSCPEKDASFIFGRTILLESNTI